MVSIYWWVTFTPWAEGNGVTSPLSPNRIPSWNPTRTFGTTFFLWMDTWDTKLPTQHLLSVLSSMFLPYFCYWCTLNILYWNTGADYEKIQESSEGTFLRQSMVLRKLFFHSFRILMFLKSSLSFQGQFASKILTDDFEFWRCSVHFVHVSSSFRTSQIPIFIIAVFHPYPVISVCSRCSFPYLWFLP